MNYPLCDVISQRQNFHEIFRSQFVRNRSKDTRADRLALLVHYNDGILIEPNFAPIAALSMHGSANNHAVHNLSLLDLAARDGVLDRGDDEVAELPVFSAAQDLDARDTLGAGVVRDFQTSPHLHKRPALLLKEACSRRSKRRVAIGSRRC